MHILWWMIVGLIVGWITRKIMRGYGPPMDIVMGIAGAAAGSIIMRSAGFSGQGGMIYTTLVAILGADILTVLIGFASGRRQYA